MKRWTAATSGLPTFPLIAGGHVYFTDGASLHALGAMRLGEETGAVVWESGLAVGEGWLLVPAGTTLVAYSTAAPAGVRAGGPRAGP